MTVEEKARRRLEINKAIAADFVTGERNKRALVEKYKDAYKEIGCSLNLARVTTSITNHCSQEFLEKLDAENIETVKRMKAEGKTVDEIIRATCIPENNVRHILAQVEKGDKKGPRDNPITPKVIEDLRKKLKPGSKVRMLIVRDVQRDDGRIITQRAKEDVVVKALYPNFAETDHGTMQYGTMVIGMREAL